MESKERCLGEDVGGYRMGPPSSSRYTSSTGAKFFLRSFGWLMQSTDDLLAQETCSRCRSKVLRESF